MHLLDIAFLNFPGGRLHGIAGSRRNGKGIGGFRQQQLALHDLFLGESTSSQ